MARRHPETDGEHTQRGDSFDPIVEGARYGLPRALLLALWERVRCDASDSDRSVDELAAERRFHEVASRIAARGGWLRRTG